jgi:RinA family phage transcriptional activator
MRKTFQHIEQELYSFHNTKREIEQLRNDIIHSTSQREGNGSGYSRGSVVEAKVTRLLTNKRIEFLQDVADAIQEVYDALPNDKKRFVDLRYFKKPQLLSWEGIALECNISRRTAFMWRDEIVKAIAVKMGWH